VIHMQINSDDLHFLVGNYDILENMSKVPALKTFSKCSMDFFSNLSKEILKDRRSRKYVDVMSYAYWIRKASIENVKEKHLDRKNRIGRGVAFHIAPSNVPVNFAVSMTSSLLAGNATIIRVSNKNFEQVDIICDAINKILCNQCKDMQCYLCLIRYEHSELITQELSNMCDVRIIWGGNNTINTIRKAALPSRAIEMAFADRYSLAVINSNTYLNENLDEIAKRFYTDTYYSDQNACSSPRLVVWLGDKVEEARGIFWKKMNEIVENDYEMKPIQAVDKFTSLSMLGMRYDGVRLVSDNNLVVRIEVDKLYPELMDYKNGGGYFFEYKASKLDDIVPVLTKQCQTISVLGIDKQDILDIVFKYGVRGVDRIVELGQTMALEFIWDGFKMIETMSRFIYSGGY
jgi:hypothetical protein